MLSLEFIHNHDPLSCTSTCQLLPFALLYMKNVPSFHGLKLQRAESSTVGAMRGTELHPLTVQVLFTVTVLKLPEPLSRLRRT